MVATSLPAAGELPRNFQIWRFLVGTASTGGLAALAMNKLFRTHDSVGKNDRELKPKENGS
jgi:hypothetical protein